MANIPDHAKIVHNGILFDVFAFEQPLFDGTTKTFEMVRRNPAVEIIAVVDGKIITLFQKQPGRETGYYSLPGGQIDPGETPIVAAKRELREETGYEASELTELFHFNGTSKLEFHEHIFKTTNLTKKTEQSLDGGEIIEVQYSTFDEFLQLARDPKAAIAYELKMTMYEALLDDRVYHEFKSKIFSS